MKRRCMGEFCLGLGFFACFLKTFGLTWWLKELDVVRLELVGPELWKWFEGNNTRERNVHALTIQTKKYTWSLVF